VHGWCVHSIVLTIGQEGGYVIMLRPPRFHHLHLRSTDPAAVIAFYTRQFPTATSGSWGGFPALFAPNEVMILFDKVDAPTSMRWETPAR